ncbi:hypothetical protein QR46_2948 [Giardia duodenalis assemblage B]|uniref:Uncharacterized protein n=1 Tax=Giardia duodenalis assemblage B TaxID=1394984 RepID=A0A132NSJ8_GIAIN|nr:hypothetical protein QR46_2948 [Giardia intestinalis assemblage B]
MICCKSRKDELAEECTSGTMNCSAIAVADASTTLETTAHGSTSLPHSRQPARDSSGEEIVITPVRILQFRSFMCRDRSSSSSISLHEGANSFRLDSCDSSRHMTHRRRKRKHKKDEESQKDAKIEDIIQLCKGTFETVEGQSSTVLLEEQRVRDSVNEDRKGTHIPRKLLNDPLTPISSSRLSA